MLAHGILCVDKPPGISSMSALSRVRKTTGAGRIGHSGTLDPAASGLLVIALGNATRLFPFLRLEPKTYRFSVRFGRTTDTLDAEGNVVEEGGAMPSEDAVRDVLGAFIGEIEQQPPRFSALKVGGVRAYRRARRNERFELAPRRVHVYSLVLERYNADENEAVFEVQCSAGVYVRSLARDIALKLGTIGLAASIRRTAMGAFSLSQALPPGASRQELEKALRPLSHVLSSQPVYTATAAQLRALAHGMDIEIGEAPGTGEHLFVFDSENELAAVARRRSAGTFHPIRVFHAV